jgi:hypothetical protein
MTSITNKVSTFRPPTRTKLTRSGHSSGPNRTTAPDFVRLANAVSAGYPKDSEEKGLLRAMLLAVPR